MVGEDMSGTMHCLRVKEQWHGDKDRPRGGGLVLRQDLGVGIGLLRPVFNVSRGSLCLHGYTSLSCHYKIMYISSNLSTCTLARVLCFIFQHPECVVYAQSKYWNK